MYCFYVQTCASTWPPESNFIHLHTYICKQNDLRTNINGTLWVKLPTFSRSFQQDYWGTSVLNIVANILSPWQNLLMAIFTDDLCSKRWVKQPNKLAREWRATDYSTPCIRNEAFYAFHHGTYESICNWTVNVSCSVGTVTWLYSTILLVYCTFIT